MTAGYNVSFKTEMEIHWLRKRVEGFESGELYRKITDEYEEKLAEKDRMIKAIEHRLTLSNENCRLLMSGNEALRTDLFFRDNEISRLKTVLADV